MLHIGTLNVKALSYLSNLARVQASNFPAATTAMAVGALASGRGAPQKITFSKAIIAVPLIPVGRRALFKRS